MQDSIPFQKWSIFLPCAVSTEREKLAVYYQSRQSGNPQFFEKSRAKLQGLLDDCGLCRAGQIQAAEAHGFSEALEYVLEAQRAALGFLCNAHLHKAITLGELSRDLTDALIGTDQQFIFWRILSRANLANAYTRFKRYDSARAVLTQGLELAETAKEATGARERVLVAVCYSCLAQIELQQDGGQAEEVMRLTDLAIELFERFLLELSDAKEDKENNALVLSTAYAIRGSCDVQKEKYDSALAWYARAQECVEKYKDLGNDGNHISASIQKEIETTRLLQSRP